MMTSDQLRAWRAEKRWTQRQAADALGYKERGYQEIEKADGEISRRVELAVIGYEALSVPRNRYPPIDFRNADWTTCYLQFDQIPHSEGQARVVGLIGWAQEWGAALTNSKRPIQAPGFPR